MNAEVAFDCFSLTVPDTAPPSSVFDPRITAGCVDGRHVLGMSFPSALDGPGMSHARGEVLIQLSIVLDISGSMGSRMPEDEQSKLEVAKKSITAILRQLAPTDQVAITLFDHNQQLLLPLQPVGHLDMSTTERMIEQLRPCGGTRLAAGFKAGAAVLSGATPATTVKRIIFMTDMQSGPADEAEVLNALRVEAATHRSFTTVFGIGVDLSMAAVQQISSTLGGKYVSVAIAEEFERRLSAEFVHDTIPIAFDIQVQMLDGEQIAWTAGHPELAGLQAGSSSFQLSSEFSSPDQGNTGMILLQLQPSATAGTSELRAKFSWTALDGQQHTRVVSTARLQEGFGCDSLRKAVAVSEWVRLLDEYVMNDTVEDAQERVGSSQRWIERFEKFKPSFQQQVELSGDLSLRSSNLNFIQTLDQMIHTERTELDKARTQLTQHSPAAHPAAASLSGSPHDFLCPISQALMCDPVIACDGHSYERSQITQWFSQQLTSPKTGAALSTAQLIPNHTLKAAILSFIESKSQSCPATEKRVTRSKKASVMKPAAKCARELAVFDAQKSLHKPFNSQAL
eukprot:TRINITY_DN6256_c0_g2_i1.p1 TRINITY_DN6256_c0_g2~~TRINITY_DN6256_c0_g2_i1.p1  ORF type:complete len:568 (+),score=161.77 TRINITY_DN6256_c0_g2_i1:233-1936(+)